MDKTEGSPIGLGRNFGKLNSSTNPLAKVVDFVPLGALSGPGAPDPDLARFHIRVKHGILNISLHVCKKMHTVSVQMRFRMPRLINQRYHPK